MEIFILSFIIISLAALGMAVGVLAGGAGLKGTCATLSGSEYASIACQICPARHWRGARGARRCARQGFLSQNAEPPDTTVAGS